MIIKDYPPLAHAIGNGEVDSSILSGSTRIFANNGNRRHAGRPHALDQCASSAPIPPIVSTT